MTAGTLLVGPADQPRAADVLCLFDSDGEDGWFALILNRQTDARAQPLAFGLFDCGDTCAWWGGPTRDVFALVQLDHKVIGSDDEYLPESNRSRPYVTAETGVWRPGKDHAPSTARRVRVFLGSVWLSPTETGLYNDEGHSFPATNDLLFDLNPLTLADRLRAE